MASNTDIPASLESCFTPFSPPPERLAPLTRARALLLASVLEKAADSLVHTASRSQSTLLSIRASLFAAETLKCAAAGDTALETLIHYTHCIVMCLLSATRAAREREIKPYLSLILSEQTDILYRLSNLLVLNQNPPVRHRLDTQVEILPCRPLCSQHRHPSDLWIGLDAPAPQTRYIAYALSAVMHCQYGAALSFRDAYGLNAEVAAAISQHIITLHSLLKSNEPGCAYACLIGDELTEDDHDPLLKNAARTAAIAQRKMGAQTLPPITRAFCLTHGKGYISDTCRLLGHTLCGGHIKPLHTLKQGSTYRRFSRRVVPDAALMPSHRVVEDVIAALGTDYRCEIAPHPIKALRDRTRDDTTVGR